jgi:putative ABC transport system permease protein
MGILSARSLTRILGWPTDVDPMMAFAAFAGATLSGVFFGWYPARRAGATDPIDALRYE